MMDVVLMREPEPLCPVPAGAGARPIFQQQAAGCPGACFLCVYMAGTSYQIPWSIMAWVAIWMIRRRASANSSGVTSLWIV